MCGRYTLRTKDRDELTGRFEARIDSALDSALGRFNVAPSQQVLTVERAEEDAPERVARRRRWGLVPKWAKDPKVGYRMINSRSETVREKPSFRPLVGKWRHRCLVVADGWYEWLRDEAKRTPPQPFHFTVDEGAPFAFAGLCTRAELEGEEILSCTIMTTAPNEVAARIHDRMPVVLAGPEAEAAWLDPGVGSDDAVELLRSLEAQRLALAPANPKVNKVGKGMTEGPELLVPPDAEPGDAEG